MPSCWYSVANRSMALMYQGSTTGPAISGRLLLPRRPPLAAPSAALALSPARCRRPGEGRWRCASWALARLPAARPPFVGRGLARPRAGC
eukprot:13756370-Alexandrium_andersonii.AAC.1